MDVMEDLRRVPTPVWIGVAITVVVAIVVTRSTAQQSAAIGAQTAAKTTGAGGGGVVSGADFSNAIQALTQSMSSAREADAKNLQDAMAKIEQNQANLNINLAAGFRQEGQAIAAEQTNTQASLQTLVKGISDQNAQLAHENTQAMQSAIASLGQSFGSPLASLGAAFTALQNTLASQSAAVDRLGQEVQNASHQTQVIYQPAAGAAFSGSSGGGNNASALHAPASGSVVSYSGHSYDLGSDAGRAQLINDAQNNVVPSGPGGTYVQRILDAHPPG